MSRGLPFHFPVPKFKRGGGIPIKVCVQQMEYYFSITGITEKKHVLSLINNFDSIHFPAVQAYKTYSYHEFRKIISNFKTPDLTQVNIKELMSAEQNPDDPILET